MASNKKIDQKEFQKATERFVRQGGNLAGTPDPKRTVNKAVAGNESLAGTPDPKRRVNKAVAGNESLAGTPDPKRLAYGMGGGGGGRGKQEAWNPFKEMADNRNPVPTSNVADQISKVKPGGKPLLTNPNSPFYDASRDPVKNPRKPPAVPGAATQAMPQPTAIRPATNSWQDIISAYFPKTGGNVYKEGGLVRGGGAAQRGRGRGKMC